MYFFLFHTSRNDPDFLRTHSHQSLQIYYPPQNSQNTSSKTVRLLNPVLLVIGHLAPQTLQRGGRADAVVEPRALHVQQPLLDERRRRRRLGPLRVGGGDADQLLLRLARLHQEDALLHLLAGVLVDLVVDDAVQADLLQEFYGGRVGVVVAPAEDYQARFLRQLDLSRDLDWGDFNGTTEFMVSLILYIKSKMVCTSQIAYNNILEPLSDKNR